MSGLTLAVGQVSLDQLLLEEVLLTYLNISIVHKHSPWFLGVEKTITPKLHQKLGKGIPSKLKKQ